MWRAAILTLEDLLPSDWHKQIAHNFVVGQPPVLLKGLRSLFHHQQWCFLWTSHHCHHFDFCEWQQNTGALSPLATMSLLWFRSSFLFHSNHENEKVLNRRDFLFVFLLRAENLSDLRKEVGAWCAVWLLSGGTARWRFCWGQPVLVSAAPHTGPYPWWSSGCWAPAAPPTTRQDWGKSEEPKCFGWRWTLLFCYGLY